MEVASGGEGRSTKGVAWRIRGIALAAGLVLGLSVMVDDAAAERRVALVIGNGAYSALPSLVNPTTDASDMASVLASLGFEVMQHLDVGLAEMESALVDFEAAISDADVALVYFAGHGLQVSLQNYLVPVDAELTSEEDVYERTLRFDSILARLGKAPGIKLVFLDACQDNPLPKTDGSLSDGLARVGNAAEFLITFATQPGMVAYDGVGRNSPFADALLTHLPKKGVEILPMLASVNADVNSATGGLQTPYVQFSVKPEFFFVPGEPDTETPDLQLWRLAARAEDPALLQIYLTRFPEGPHASDARSLLSEIGADPSLPSVAADDSAVEETLWQLGRNSRTHGLVDLYLTRYPDGRFAEEARRMLSSLTPADDPDMPPGTRCAQLATHPRDATANVAGVSMAVLSRNAVAAVEVCRRAVAAHPELPHYQALLARSEAARGNIDEAVNLFQAAADRGDGRALVSLGLMTAAGDGVQKDPARAVELFRMASERGSVDGKINLAVALMQGAGVERDVDQALTLMREAADTGSPIALFNLAALTERGVAGDPAAALDLFRKAAEQGYAGGWRAAAVMLDEGRGAAKDPALAAEYLLNGAAADGGELIGELTTKTATWSLDTIRALQERLQGFGYYTGAIDGRSGPKFAAALRQWRLLGPPQSG
ncbi:MAG TPA: caspase family protein [Methylomirabilota bacterium]|nr:caspase family protein [Methylomirabilota bacterium]